MSLILSSNPTFIYAGDLARIGEQVWLLLGHSDMSLSLQSIGGDGRSLIAQGGVCLDARGRDGQWSLWGRYDRGAIIPPEADSMKVHAWYPIDVLAYCLDQDTTARLFGASPLSLRPVRASVVGRMAMRDPYAGSWARPLMDEAAYDKASSPRKRFRFMERLDELMPALRCYLLPFQSYDSRRPPVKLTLQPGPPSRAAARGAMRSGVSATAVDSPPADRS